MTNHVHLIVSATQEDELSNIIRDFKKFTSKKLVEQIQYQPESRREWMLDLFGYTAKGSKRHKSFKFWKAANHALELYSPKFIWEKVIYIHNNPVESGFVESGEEWRYSSAGNYVGKDNVLIPEVECIPALLRTVS